MNVLILCVLNLGDSACIVVRDGKQVAKSREISHYFDCPYQLSTDSPDIPRDGTKLNYHLQRGDIVIMGSDGVFDNLFDSDIVDCTLLEMRYKKKTNHSPSALEKC